MAFSTVTPILTPAQFRTDLPEFSDKNAYQDSTLTYWIAVASFLLNPQRFEDPNILYLAAEMFVAHNMVIEAQAQSTAEVGGWPGISKGAISAESPGAVSVSYDTVSTLEEGAGNFNLTVYGTRFWNLCQMAGAGPVQIGPSGGCAGTVLGASDGGPAWSGPNCRPGMTTFGG